VESLPSCSTIQSQSKEQPPHCASASSTACPVAFKGTEWIRVGGVKKKLKDHPGKEKKLWLVLARMSFETGI
jgi:hypothetical protein